MSSKVTNNQKSTSEFEESERTWAQRERERCSSLLVALGFRERDTGPVGCGGLLGRER